MNTFSRLCSVTVLDPLELKWPVLETPAFFYDEGKAPADVAAAAAAVKAADCFVLVCILPFSVVFLGGLSAL
jgi:hypothetical protein